MSMGTGSDGNEMTIYDNQMREVRATTPREPERLALPDLICRACEWPLTICVRCQHNDEFYLYCSAVDCRNQGHTHGVTRYLSGRIWRNQNARELDGQVSTRRQRTWQAVRLAKTVAGRCSRCAWTNPRGTVIHDAGLCWFHYRDMTLSVTTPREPAIPAVVVPA